MLYLILDVSHHVMMLRPLFESMIAKKKTIPFCREVAFEPELFVLPQRRLYDIVE
jgi:hypothetical protein